MQKSEPLTKEQAKKLHKIFKTLVNPETPEDFEFCKEFSERVQETERKLNKGSYRRYSNEI